MAPAIVLTILNTQSGETVQRTFMRTPIRIGRNILNDLRLDDLYVSQFHAVLEVYGDRLSIRDLGSRNGTLLRNHPGRVPPNGSMALEECGNEFFIPPYGFRVAVQEVVEETVQSSRRPPAEEFTYTQLVPLRRATQAPSASEFQASIAAFARVRQTLFDALSNAAGTLGPEALEEFSRDLQRAYPEIAEDQRFKEIFEPIPVDYESARELRAAMPRPPPVEAAALHGLRVLATRFLPRGPTIDSIEDIASFCSRVTQTLHVLFRCFVPLRDGQKFFESQMRIERVGRTGAYVAASPLDLARTEDDIAAVMLDWRVEEDGVYDSADGMFADLMIHQVALLNGVMGGVKSLLHELSPEAIQRSVDDPRSRAGGGLQIGPFRFQKLWEAFVEKHADFAEEERFAFEVIFGPRFADAYRRYNAAATAPVRVPPPDPK